MSHTRAVYTQPMLLSAIITGLCVGGALGFPFWHGLLVRSAPDPVAGLIEWLVPGQVSFSYWPAVILIGGFLWGWLLGRLNGFHKRWKLGIAGGLSVLIGQIAVTTYPIHGFANQLWPGLPIHLRFDIEFVVSTSLAAGVAGLTLGMAVKNWRARLALFLGSSSAVGLSTFFVIAGFELLDVRVGGGNAAMAKISALGFLVAAIAAGAVIGRILAQNSPDRDKLD